MNHTILVKNYLVENERKINNILRWFSVGFLILCPALFLAREGGMIAYDLSTLIKACVLITALCLFPVFFVKYSYNEKMNRAVCLVVLEIMICIIGCNGVVKISLAYALVPLLSVLYIDREIFVNTARYCFLAMLIVKAVTFLFRLQISLKNEVAYEAEYLPFVAIVLEYIVIMLILYFMLQRLEDMVSSGYKIEQREDGTFVSKAIKGYDHKIEMRYNIKGLFLEVGQILQSMIRNKEKKFHITVDSELPSVLKGDPEKIKHAMVNMLSDLIQFTKTGEVSVDVTYEKGIVAKKGQNITVVCKIMCTENLAEDLRYGNALGFALAKNTIQKINGVILNKSGGNPYRTKFVVSFQQLVEEEKTIMQLRMQHKEEQDYLILDSRKKAENMMYVKEGKALIVDDSVMNQKLVAAILKSYGLESVCVSTGKEALEALESKDINLVILDYMMPVKGGMQIAKEIRQMGEPYYRELPLIAMTSNSTEESKIKFFENGFEEVISKPIKENELRLAIAHCMCL